MQLHDSQEKRSSSKYIFVIICSIVTVLTIPIIVPHLSHSYMVYHILTHVASLAVSVFISYIAIRAYVKTSKIRMLFMALGFTILAVVELFMLLTATGNLHDAMLPIINVEFPHLALLLMISLFGMGILKID